MATNTTAQHRHRRAENSQQTRDVATDDELLELLGDEYTRTVLQTVIEQPQSGSDIVEMTDMSKATVYRRLETLQEAGLVDTQTVFDPEGHHHEQFEAVVDEFTVSLEGGELSAEIPQSRPEKRRL